MNPQTDEPSEWRFIPRQVKSWQDAEANAAAWMRSVGFRDAHVTQGGADGGIDVASREAVAQVKMEARQVGRSTLQTFVGATIHGDGKRLFFTGTGYSQPARSYADDQGIALFTYSLDGQVCAVNGAAQTVEREARRHEPIRGVPSLLTKSAMLVLALTFTTLWLRGIVNPVNWPPTMGTFFVGSLLLGTASFFWLRTVGLFNQGIEVARRDWEELSQSR